MKTKKKKINELIINNYIRNMKIGVENVTFAQIINLFSFIITN